MNFSRRSLALMLLTAPSLIRTASLCSVFDYRQTLSIVDNKECLCLVPCPSTISKTCLY